MRGGDPCKILKNSNKIICLRDSFQLVRRSTEWHWKRKGPGDSSERSPARNENGMLKIVKLNRTYVRVKARKVHNARIVVVINSFGIVDYIMILPTKPGLHKRNPEWLGIMQVTMAKSNLVIFVKNVFDTFEEVVNACQGPLIACSTSTKTIQKSVKDKLNVWNQPCTQSVSSATFSIKIESIGFSFYGKHGTIEKTEHEICLINLGWAFPRWLYTTTLTRIKNINPQILKNRCWRYSFNYHEASLPNSFRTGKVARRCHVLVMVSKTTWMQWQHVYI